MIQLTHALWQEKYVLYPVHFTVRSTVGITILMGDGAVLIGKVLVALKCFPGNLNCLHYFHQP